MRFASPWIGALLGSLALLSCSASSVDETQDLTGGAAGSTSAPFVDATVAFEGPASIEVKPGEVREIAIVTSPAAEYEMYLALLDAPSDASLDASYLVTGPDGRATVKLHAPSSLATFRVRASIKNGPSAELLVLVNKQGVGALEVVPVYDGGRPIASWVASVVAGKTCSSLAGVLPGEPTGALVAVAPSPESPVVQSVPVGPKLAVAVRAGHFAWGCVDASGITAGTTTKVKVHVVDVPPALDRTSLQLKLDYSPSEPYAALLSGARTAFLDAFLPPGASEGSALLDGMAARALDPAAFYAAREALGWDALVEAHVATLSAAPAERMAGWIDLGLAQGTAELTGGLAAIDGVPDKALFSASTLGGLDAASSGVPAEHLMSWTSQPGDQVVLSGAVYWVPSRFIGAACRAGAESELDLEADMADLLSAVTGCNALAAALGGVDECDADCLAYLCHVALADRWVAALDASALDGAVGKVSITASGQVTVDDVATPVALAGSWIGQVSDGFTTASVKGSLSGALPSEPDAPADPGDPPPQ